MVIMIFLVMVRFVSWILFMRVNGSRRRKLKVFLSVVIVSGE